MKKLSSFVLAIAIVVVSNFVFTSCYKHKKERIIIAEDAIVGTWSGDYSDNGAISITFSKGSPYYTFKATISYVEGGVAREYEKIDGKYVIYGSLLSGYECRLFVENVSIKDEEGWSSMTYNEWVVVKIAFNDNNNAKAYWGKDMTATVKRN